MNMYATTSVFVLYLFIINFYVVTIKLYTSKHSLDQV